MKPKKLLLAGSHAGATAIAIVKEIKKEKLPWRVFWVGKKWATEEKTSFTLEYNMLPKMGVTFFPLESGRIQTKFTRYTVSSFLKVPLGFLVAGYIVAKIKPDVILTFGGAAGAEASFWGWVFGIPVIVHEQTSVAGRANLFSSKFANAVAVSRDSSLKFFKGKNTVLTGNPVDEAILTAKPHARQKPFTIFITGGSRGSQRLNEAVEPILRGLLKKYNVVWQVGDANMNKIRLKDKNLRIYGQINSQDWLETISMADIVVSRAGANIVSELIALKKPCILIPIPWTYLDEQTQNANFAKNFGIANVLSQDRLTPQALNEEIEDVENNYSKILSLVETKTSPDIEASKNLVKLLKKYAQT